MFPQGRIQMAHLVFFCVKFSATKGKRRIGLVFEGSIPTGVRTLLHALPGNKNEMGKPFQVYTLFSLV